MRPSEEQIRKVAAEIGERFQPDRVILFGSWARGHAQPDSDVDMLVIMDYAGSSVDESLRLLKAVNEKFSIELLVRSPKEVERRVQLGDVFLREILQEGKVLYERPHLPSPRTPLFLCTTSF